MMRDKIINWEETLGRKYVFEMKFKKLKPRKKKKNPSSVYQILTVP